MSNYLSFPGPTSLRALFLFSVFALIAFGGCKDAPTESEELPELPQPRAVDEFAFTQTPSGLKYYDFVVGDTERARADSADVVLINYHAWTEDGTLFDSSIINQQPFQFLLGFGFVVDGLDEGIQGMYLGGERQIVIPPELGFGNRVFGVVPANSTLIYEVILLGAQ